MKQNKKNPYATNGSVVRAPQNADRTPPKAVSIIGDDLRCGKKKSRKDGK